jgi:hypothetical protein
LEDRASAPSVKACTRFEPGALYSAARQTTKTLIVVRPGGTRIADRARRLDAGTPNAPGGEDGDAKELRNERESQQRSVSRRNRFHAFAASTFGLPAYERRNAPGVVPVCCLKAVVR